MRGISIFKIVKPKQQAYSIIFGVQNWYFDTEKWHWKGLGVNSGA
jgi:hypothetical protein